MALQKENEERKIEIYDPKRKIICKYFNSWNMPFSFGGINYLMVWWCQRPSKKTFKNKVKSIAKQCRQKSKVAKIIHFLLSSGKFIKKTKLHSPTRN